MYLFHSASKLSQFIQIQRNKYSKSIGFVPTMGALHQGHQSLVQASKSKAGLTVCSIFVNPTQFNQKSDLENYPKTLSKDIELLIKVGCDVLFFPTVQEIYPEGTSKKDLPEFDLAPLDSILEGKFRPGHFQGVAQVVSRLLAITTPDYLFLGQKDYQQIQIIKRLVNIQTIPVEIISCPIIREEDGLALSSRNVRLTPELKKQAHIIFNTLNWVKDHFHIYSVEELQEKAWSKLDIPGFKTEYFEIVDGQTLEKWISPQKPQSIIACVAVWVGEVRLIDNMVIK